MTPYLTGTGTGTGTASASAQQSSSLLLDGTYAALDHLLEQVAAQLPRECLSHVARTQFSTANTGGPYFPSPLKQTEAISALKAVEAGLAASIADLNAELPERSIKVDLERASAFLFSTYLATVGGMDKANPKVNKYLKGTHGSLSQPLTVLLCISIRNHSHEADLAQIRIFSKLSPFSIAGFPQTSMQPGRLESTSICMALWRLPKRLT